MASGAGGNGQTSQTEKQAADQGDNGEERNGAEDNITEKDGVLYKDYKGPVQGEIKYKEGTPADENSDGYRASGDIDSPYQVDLIVTRDFGHTKMFGKPVGLVQDEVGMEVLLGTLISRQPTEAVLSTPSTGWNRGIRFLPVRREKRTTGFTGSTASWRRWAWRSTALSPGT